MAHMIEHNQIAYKGATPWHGLGVQVADNASGTEMLVAAGLNWKVQRRALAMRSNRAKLIDGQLVASSDMLTKELDGFRAITRSDTNKVFTVASDRYQPVQNQAIVDFFKEFCEAGHASMETVGALRDGAVVWALAKLEGASQTVDMLGDDKVEGYMLLATSHDGSLATIGQPTQTRVVCHNTLTAAMASGSKQTTYKLRHSSKFDSAAKDDARAVMTMASQQVVRMNDLAGDLARVTLDHDGWIQFMTGLLGGQDAVIDPKSADMTRLATDIATATISSPGSGLASAKGTLWGAVNGVTYYVDHVSRSKSDQNRLFSAWFGPGNSLKDKAVTTAMEMAGISR